MFHTDTVPLLSLVKLMVSKGLGSKESQLSPDLFSRGLALPPVLLDPSANLPALCIREQYSQGHSSPCLHKQVESIGFERLVPDNVGAQVGERCHMFLHSTQL